MKKQKIFYSNPKDVLRVSKDPSGYFTDIDEGKPSFFDNYFQKSQAEAVHREEPKSEAIDRIEMAKYESMKKKLIFKDNIYRRKRFKPKLYFYRYMAPLPEVPPSVMPKTQRLQMWLPNTIIYDGESSPFWVFTRDGYVYRIENFTNSQVISRLGSVNKYELVAVSKSQKFDEKTGKLRSNNVELLNTEGLKEKLRRLGSTSEHLCIQKFVKSKGKKSFVCRCVWSVDKAPYCFIITNKKSYDDKLASDYQRCLINIDDSTGTSIIHTLSGSQCEETGRYMKNLARFIQMHTRIQLVQLVGDFTKDDAGDWYFLSLYAFKERNPDSLSNFRLFLDIDYGNPNLDSQPQGREEKKVNKNERENYSLNFFYNNIEDIIFIITILLYIIYCYLFDIYYTYIIIYNKNYILSILNIIYNNIYYIYNNIYIIYITK